MLDMGFIQPSPPDRRQLLRDRQTVLFSATMPTEIAGLAAPAPERPGPRRGRAAGDDRRHRAAGRADRDRPTSARCSRARRRPRRRPTIVFTRTKHGANRVAEHLVGRRRPPMRSTATRRRTRGSARSRVPQRPGAGSSSPPTWRPAASTSTASPTSSTTTCPTSRNYVHRIGRTGRTGADGHGDHALRARRDEEAARGGEDHASKKTLLPGGGDGDLPPAGKAFPRRIGQAAQAGGQARRSRAVRTPRPGPAPAPDQQGGMTQGRGCPGGRPGPILAAARSGP